MDDAEALIRLGRIEEKVDGLHGKLSAKLDDHEQRLRRSEYSLWTGAGILAAAAALVKFGGH